MTLESTTPNSGHEIGGKIQNGPESKVKPKNFEDVFVALGNPGWYPIIQIILLYTTIIPMAFTNTRYVFIGSEPNFTCSQVNVTDLYTDAGISSNETHLYRTLYEESCDVEIQKNVSRTWTNVKSISCSHGYDFDGGKDVSFITEWGLVCDKKGIPQLAQACIAIGGFVGLIFINMIADKLGRKSIIICSLVLTGATELATAYTPNVYLLMTTCFFSGVFTAGLYVCTYVLFFELVKSSHRVVVSVIAGMVWSSCIILLCGVAYAFRNSGWRDFQMGLALICWSPLLFMYFVNESPLWLHTMGYKKQAEKIIRQACKTNGVSFDDKIKALFDELFENDETDQKVERKDEKQDSENVLDLFRHKELVMVLSITFFVCFANEITYSGLFLTSSTLVGNQYLNMSILAMMGIPAGITNYILLGLNGRKFVIIMFTLLTALTLLISTCVGYLDIGEDTAEKISLAFFVLGKYTNSAGYNALLMYIPEAFPTNLRSTGTGLATSGSTVGGAIAAYLLPLKKIASWAPGASLVTCSLLAAALFVKLPETKGKQLVSKIESNNPIKADRKNRKRDAVFSISAGL